MYAVIMAMAAYGWGHHSYYESTHRRHVVLHLNFTWGLLWVACITQIRISIACSLLKLSPLRLWKTPLYIIIGVQVLIFIGYYIIIFGCITPLAANWSRVHIIKHWPLKPIEIFTWVVAGKYIALLFSVQTDISRSNDRHGSRPRPDAHNPNPHHPHAAHAGENPHRSLDGNRSHSYGLRLQESHVLPH